MESLSSYSPRYTRQYLGRLYDAVGRCRNQDLMTGSSKAYDCSNGVCWHKRDCHICAGSYTNDFPLCCFSITSQIGWYQAQKKKTAVHRDVLHIPEDIRHDLLKRTRLPMLKVQSTCPTQQHDVSIIYPTDSHCWRPCASADSVSRRPLFVRFCHNCG